MLKLLCVFPLVHAPYYHSSGYVSHFSENKLGNKLFNINRRLGFTNLVTGFQDDIGASRNDIDILLAQQAFCFDAGYGIVLQFHGAEPPALCRSFGRPYLKALAVFEQGDLLESSAIYGDAAGILLDAPPADGLPGGTGRRFDWARVPAGLPRPLVLGGGLDAGNVAEAIRRVRPWAVDVSSGVEARDADGRTVKGVKDPARIAAFIEEARHADG